MAASTDDPSGPDFRSGVPLASIPAAGVLAGHVDGAPALMSRHDGHIVAVSGSCTHYGAPLAEGMFADGEVRCPWHHACFSLRTGKALKAPAFASLTTWQVEVVDDTVFVRGENDAAPRRTPTRSADDHPRRIVIIGGGAAGFAAAERLRERGFDGSIRILSADAAPPCDRPNLSKDFLAGTAPADWIPLKPEKFYRDERIDLTLDCTVSSIDVDKHEVATRTGENVAFDRLLIATGATPVRLPLRGFSAPNVFTLRSLADAHAIIAAAEKARSAVLIGAGFIGLEVAASLRHRGIDVDVLARDALPMEKILGREFGEFVTSLHREHGVRFHLQRSPKSFDGRVLTLDDGTTIETDMLVVGVGVKPCTEIAKAAGLATDNGVIVDTHLKTSASGIFAAGDIACFPWNGDRIRVEHWVHAERMGQCAAENLLGACRPFDDVPFFWSQHYDASIRYTGHAAGWDQIRCDGSLAKRDFVARYFRGGRLVAAATLGRDRENLAIAAELRDLARASIQEMSSDPSLTPSNRKVDR